MEHANYELNIQLKALNQDLNSRIEKINFFKRLNKERLALHEKEIVLKKENCILEKEKKIYNRNLDSLLSDYSSLSSRFLVISDLHYLSKLEETKKFLNLQINEWTNKNKEENLKIKFKEAKYLRFSRKLDEESNMNNEYDNLEFKVKYYEEKWSDLKLSKWHFFF